MKRNEKNIFAALVILAVSLGTIAAIGTSFCAYAAILFVPAFVPILAFGAYKLLKLNFAKKANNSNK